ncbi:MAG: phosphate starvation-inducible protein PhoH [Synechococcus sp. TMED19]|nr:MAG: phosphate starvation-inducible protein PhoH [Synechococcus sp. TMED19]
MSKKVVVLDTNVLLHDPDAPSNFGSDRIVLPIQVVEEIDRFKRDPSEKGRNSRRVARLLDGLRQRGNLADGVPLIPGGQGTLEVAFCRAETLAQLPPELQGGGGDNNILAVALEQMRSKGLADPPEVVLITKDTNLRIKADAVGLDAEDYSSDKVAIADLYAGARSLNVPASLIDELHHNGHLSVQVLPADAVVSLQPNEGVTLVDTERPDHTFLARQKGDSGELEPLLWLKRARLGRVKPRNREQSFALDLLLDPAVQLVTLVGKAGTGKTLLAIAAGLHQVADEHRYARLLVTRPPISLGKEIGFLPGSLDEKLAPWMQPIVDNLDFLTGDALGDEQKDDRRRHGGGPKSSWADLRGMGLLEVEAINYIRGRSIPHQFMVVDEAQNLTPHEVKTIVTRVGEGTKIVFTGDPYQIDNPYVDAESNGLTWLAERLKGQSLVGHMTLTRGERSALAELAANML